MHLQVRHTGALRDPAVFKQAHVFANEAAKVSVDDAASDAECL